MRRTLAFLVAVTAMGTLSATAQGTLNLINSTSTRVMDACGFAYITADMGYRVELLWGASSGCICSSLGYVSFTDAPGIFNGGVVTLGGAVAGDRPWITIRIWDTQGGKVMTWAEALRSTHPLSLSSHTWQFGRGLGGPLPPLPDGTPTPDDPPPSLADGGFVDAFQWAMLDCPIPLLNPVSSGTQVRFEFDSRAGYQYKLMFRPSFDVGSAWEWEPRSGYDGDGTRITVVVTNDLATPSGFYKLEYWW